MSGPVTEYAWKVVWGEIVAGPHVRNSCARHLRDLVDGHERGLYFDVDEAQRAIDYFADVLTVEAEIPNEDGDIESQVVPFILEPSQAFIVGSLFGWKKENGLRRFIRAYIEIGKGNGKSPLAAGIGHYMLTATNKLRAEVYSAATDRDQAAILFRDAVEMYKRSPALFKRLITSGQNPIWQLTYVDTASFFKPISSEKKGKSGIRPYCALIDEIHEHADNSVIEMLRAGTKGNQEALILEITNSGASRQSVCWDEHVYSCQVADGTMQNDSWFSYVCALDEAVLDDEGNEITPADDPFTDESCWIKVNPLLGVSIQPEFIRQQVVEAEGMPSKESLVRRLHFCQWTDSIDGWVTQKAWEKCERTIDIEDYHGCEAYGGLDLSYTTDLSSFVLAFPVEEQMHCFAWFWKPQVGLAEAVKRDRVPYDLWADQGYLTLTPGKVISLGPIAQIMQQCKDLFDLQGIAWDEYRHKDLDEQLAELGIELPLISHPQGFRRVAGSDLWMPGSFNEATNLIIEDNLRVDVNPILRWNAACTVVRDDKSGVGNQVPDKYNSTGRIDGIVAMVEAIGLSKARQGAGVKDWLESL